MTRNTSAARIRAVAVCAIASGLLFSCWTPIFDSDISISARLEKKLEKVESFEPVSTSEWDYESGYFIPHKSLTPYDGYWINAYDSALYVRYIQATADNTIVYQSQWAGYNALGEAASISSLSEASSLGISTTMGRGLLLAISSESDGVHARGLDSSYALSIMASATLSGASYPRMVGASRSPLNETQDALAVAHYSEEYARLYFGYAIIDNSSAFAAPTIALSEPDVDSDLDFASGAFFGYSCLGYYYVSGTLEGGGLRTERWNGLADAAPVVLSGVGRQITDILSDGRLVARGGSSTIVYDASGNELFAIPTGAMRFAHEVYDSAASTWYSYFSRSVLAKTTNDHDGGKLAIDVFRTRTSELKSLAD